MSLLARHSGFPLCDGISASPSSALESLPIKPESSCETCSGQWNACRSAEGTISGHMVQVDDSLCLSLLSPLPHFKFGSESDLSKASTNPWHSCNMRKSYIFVVTGHQEFWDHIQYHLMHATDTLSFYEWRKLRPWEVWIICQKSQNS